ncbi:hypothetical protein N9W11_04905 [Psychrosphaera haliotis]|uniref:hypothetical protein n=1 Tax=Psychrosphaera haliotis TaxID=555083 RepID=UPI00237167EC|nr:hypothetical protein [Psychrosphaera haliotis]
MNKKLILELISKLPVRFNLYLMKLNAFPSLIYGKEYKKIREEFFDSQTSEFINFANLTLEKNCFYKALDYPTVKSEEDFKRYVNFIDKEIVIKNTDTLFNGDTENTDLCTTGGTSGRPLSIYLPKTRYRNELGALHAIWHKIGWDNDIRAVQRNDKLGSKTHLVNPITKEVVFDGFRHNDDYLFKIYNTMKKLRIKFFHGYTSNAERFVNFLLTHKLDYSFMKGIITSSENLYPHQNLLFAKLEGVKHLNFYGHSEKLILGAWCEESHSYHFYSSYGYPELVDESGNTVEEEGLVGELIGSTNYNRQMPLIRYKTGDFAVKGKSSCSCGFSGLSVSKILGRWNGEKIYLKDNSFITTTALNLHSDLYCHIEELQYKQDTKGVLKVLIVPGPTFNEKVKLQLLSTIQKGCLNRAEIVLEIVNEVTRHANGKYQLLISNL